MQNKVNIVLKLLLFSFPILIILGPFALNCFSVIFTFYALINYKSLKEFKVFNKRTSIIFFSFIILIFPFGSIEFQGSFFKYVSFFRFILMLFGLIIFLNKENKKNDILKNIYKTYIIFLAIIIIDVLVEYFSGSNLFGYSSSYGDGGQGRIASFTNDELIIGYILCFLILFTLIFIYKKTNHFNFFVVACIFITVSFLIGEKSNFIKLFLLMITFTFFHIFYFNKFKVKNFLVTISIIFILLIPFSQLAKSTTQGKKLIDLVDTLVVFENNKLSLNIKKEFYNTKHAPHYITAYKIFLEYPIFGMGINNFYLESAKKKYQVKIDCVEQMHRCNDIEVKTGKKIQKYMPSSTHPHQVYLEIISEVGLTGLIYFIFIFFYPVYISLKSALRSKEINVVSHLLLHIFFIFPILPSGSFFGTNYGVPFWFNLSILLYLSYKNLKIYK